MNRLWLALIMLALRPVSPGAGEDGNLIDNGRFDDPDAPMRGWVVCYEWTGNKHYVGNINRISVVPEEGGRTNVMRIANVTDAGSKVESPLITFAPNRRYRATLYVKGGPYRIEFRGYQWRPGIRPHDDPKPEELRLVYRSRAQSGSAASWERVSLEVPGVKASDLSLRHLRRVRFIRLFVYFHTDAGIGDNGFIDDVRVEYAGEI